MRTLKVQDVIQAVRPERVIGFADTPVGGVACHPERVAGGGYVFVCMDEYLEYNRWQTWRAHLERLPALNLAAVVAPEPIEGLDLPQLLAADPRPALGRIARLVHGSPDQHLRLLGVTGTNGKTTTTRLLAHVLNFLGQPCGSVGTLGIELADRFDDSGTYTTPLSPDLYADLARFRDAGAEAVAMEVSSHALALDRVEGLAFEGVILTNIERDHLDFHGTREAYAEAKGRLFTRIRPGGWGVFNAATPWRESLTSRATGSLWSFGTAGSGADYTATDLELGPAGSRFRIGSPEGAVAVRTRLAGAFQVENVLAATALLNASGIPLEAIAPALETFPPVCGRMEQIRLPGGAMAIVDYAHNPDGLEHLLKSCRAFCRGTLHVVFGCGGDRDRGKRPLMGAIAARYADVLWVTSDNPRTEDPEAIIEDILEGTGAFSGSLHREADRRQAITGAARSAGKGDVLVVAGKGHEDYQLVGHTRHPFSDQAVLRGFGGV
jgi:UDP-N-acetylmuramoyl-L-alanyl-D-glutamate--2,6-diaminopimelate ligase